MSEEELRVSQLTLENEKLKREGVFSKLAASLSKERNAGISIN